MKALSFAPQLPKIQQRYAPLLWWCYAETWIRQADFLSVRRGSGNTWHTAKGTDCQQVKDIAQTTRECLASALHVLLSSCEEKVIPYDPKNPEIRPTRLVKARKYFQERLVQADHDKLWDIGTQAEDTSDFTIMASPLGYMIQRGK